MENEATDKIKALRDSIVEECRRQGFTLDEFDRLVESLQYRSTIAKRKVYSETQI